MSRVQPSKLLGTAALPELGHGDRINLGVAAILGRLPQVSQALGAITEALRTRGTLPPRLVELVRLRIAFNNQCRSCMSIRYQSAVDDGLTEEAVCSLESPAEAENLSAAEQSALRFADLFATNHLAIDDAVYEELRRYFSEDQLVELGVRCALALGIGRLTATWNVTEDLPEEFRSDDHVLVVPWGSPSVIASG